MRRVCVLATEGVVVFSHIVHQVLYTHSFAFSIITYIVMCYRLLCFLGVFFLGMYYCILVAHLCNYVIIIIIMESENNQAETPIKCVKTMAWPGHIEGNTFFCF